MKNQNVNIEEIFKCFKDALELEDTYILHKESKYEQVPNWDSLGHMRIIAKLEEEFDLEFEIEEIIDQDTIEKIFKLVLKKMKED